MARLSVRGLSAVPDRHPQGFMKNGQFTREFIIIIIIIITWYF